MLFRSLWLSNTNLISLQLSAKEYLSELQTELFTSPLKISKLLKKQQIRLYYRLDTKSEVYCDIDKTLKRENDGKCSIEPGPWRNQEWRQENYEARPAEKLRDDMAMPQCESATPSGDSNHNIIR